MNRWLYVVVSLAMVTFFPVRVQAHNCVYAVRVVDPCEAWRYRHSGVRYLQAARHRYQQHVSHVHEAAGCIACRRQVVHIVRYARTVGLCIGVLPNGEFVYPLSDGHRWPFTRPGMPTGTLVAFYSNGYHAFVLR